MDQYISTKHAERVAIKEVWCAPSLPNCYQKKRRPESVTVVDHKKGKTHTINIKSVNNIKLLTKFYDQQKEEGIEYDTLSLESIKDRAPAYVKFLIYMHKGSKKQYWFIQYSDDAKKWLDRAAIDTMVIRTVEDMYNADLIKDPETRLKVERLLFERNEKEDLSKTFGHGRKHGLSAEDTQKLLVGTHEEYKAVFDGTFSLEYISQLEALPSGVSHPLSWLES
jgi:hypothetical protein